MTDAHGVARDQLRAFIERIERLEEEKKTIADDIKDVYGEAKGMGFIPAMLKKVIALRKKDEQQRQEEEAILDTYLAALGMLPQFDLFEEPVTREDRAKHRTSEAMADHKSLVDEMADAGLISEEARIENKALADAVATKFGNGAAQPLQSPRKAAEAVSERTAFQVEADVSAEATVEGKPSVTVALTVQHDGANVSGPERADVTGGESAATNSEIDPSEDRKEDHSLDGNADASVGGRHVTAQEHRAASAGALVQVAPATKPLRPHCRNPGEHCGGYGSTHCGSCLRAAREPELEACT